MAGETLAKQSRKKIRFILTNDVETNGRVSNDHVNKMIYGRFGKEEAGILQFMDIAEHHDAKMTFFLDFAEVHAFGDEIIDVGTAILNRGHDLQLHLHPGYLNNDFWASHGLVKNTNMFTYDDKTAEATIAFIVEMYHKSVNKSALKGAGVNPLAYRGGGFEFNSSIIRALGNNGILIDMSWNANDWHRKHRGWDYTFPVTNEFYWENGVFEIPLMYMDGNSDPRLGSQVFLMSFDNLDYMPATKCEFEVKAQMYRKVLSHFIGVYGTDYIGSMIAHSFTFLIMNEDGIYEGINWLKVEFFS